MAVKLTVTCSHCGKDSVFTLGSEARVESRSVLRREAEQKGEPPPTFDAPKAKPRVCGCGHEELWHLGRVGPCEYGHNTATGGCLCKGIHSKAKAAPKPKTNGAAAHAGLGRCERAILTVLVQRAKPSSLALVAIMAGYSPTSGSFGTAVAALRAAEYIDGPGEALVATDDGMLALGPFEDLPKGKALIDYWAGKLGPCGAAILRILAEEYPKSLDLATLADVTGYSATSGSFGTTLGKLRTLELVRGFRASDELMAEVRG